jgi:adenosylmethionine-8-amino-7-oxononanoate aminotransferase
MMSFAKGITSGYLPLGGIQISDEIRDVIMTAEYGQRWTHAYTYSGHPTCCAVGLKNLEILEREGLVERAKQRGRQLLAGLQSLRECPKVGDVRGLGLMCAVEFVADKGSKAPANLGGKVRQACLDRGLFTRTIGDILAFAPPLVISGDEVDQIVTIVREALEAVAG